MRIPVYIRWIIRRWALPWLNITTAMLLLFSFFDALNQWEGGRANLLVMLKWIVLRMPFNLYEMLPFSVLLSFMATASNWVQHGEWTIVRFSGWTHRHSIVGLLCGGLFLGGLGLFADTVNARWLGGVGVSNKTVWAQSSGYIFKIGQITITGSQTAELGSVYIYPDSTAVEQGTPPDVHFLPKATLSDNLLSFIPPAHSHLPRQLSLPFYLILEPNTLERLDLTFLASTLSHLRSTHSATTPAERILNFTFTKKATYTVWIMYWMAWGSLLFLIPPRFRHARTYQAAIFASGALLIFGHRTFSTVLMQQGFSGWWMNAIMLALGLLGLSILRRIIRRKTSA